MVPVPVRRGPGLPETVEATERTLDALRKYAIKELAPRLPATAGKIQAEAAPESIKKQASLSAEEQTEALRAAAQELRGSAEKVKERAPEWFGQQALSALERGQTQIASLAIAVGLIERQSKGAAGKILPSYSDILDVLGGKLAAPQDVLDKFSAEFSAATTRLQARSIETEFSKKATSEKQKRVIAGAELVQQKLEKDDAERAKRLLIMVATYADLLEKHGWKDWPGSNKVESAIDAELAGKPGAQVFNDAMTQNDISASASQLRTLVQKWGSDLSSQKKLVLEAADRVDELVGKGRTRESEELLPMLAMYADSVMRRSGPLAPGFEGEPMERALRAVISGKPRSEVDKEFMAGYNASQKVAVELEAARFEKLLPSRPEGKEKVEEALQAARKRAAEGNSSGAFLLLRYVAEYYGQAEKGKSEGWRYRMAGHAGQGFEEGRSMVLDAMTMEIRADSADAHVRAARAFEAATMRLADADSLRVNASLLRQRYMGQIPLIPGRPETKGKIPLGEGQFLDLELVRKYENRDPTLTGPTLIQLLSRLEGAAKTGDMRQYKLIAGEFTKRLEIVAARAARKQAMDKLAEEIGKMDAATSNIPYSNADKMMLAAQKEALLIRLRRVESTTEALAGPAPKGSSVLPRDEDALYHRGEQLYGPVKGDLSVLDEYALYVNTVDRVRTQYSLTLLIKDQLAFNVENQKGLRQYSGADTDRALVALREAGVHLKNAQAAVAGGDFKAAATEYDKAMRSRVDALIVCSPGKDTTLLLGAMDEVRRTLATREFEPYLQMQQSAFSSIISGKADGEAIQKMVRGATMIETSIFAFPSDSPLTMAAEFKERQQAVRNLVRSGNLEQAQKIINDMRETAEARQSTYNYALMGIGMTAMFLQPASAPWIGPLVGTAIFTELGFERARTEYLTNGYVSGEALVMLGLPIATFGIGELAGMLRIAANTANATRAGSLLQSARLLTGTNIAIGAGMMPYMGYESLQLFNQATEAEKKGDASLAGRMRRDAWLNLGMVLLPLAHTGGSIAWRGFRGATPRVRLGMETETVAEALSPAKIERGTKPPEPPQTAAPETKPITAPETGPRGPTPPKGIPPLADLTAAISGRGPEAEARLARAAAWADRLERGAKLEEKMHAAYKELSSMDPDEFAAEFARNPDKFATKFGLNENVVSFLAERRGQNPEDIAEAIENVAFNPELADAGPVTRRIGDVSARSVRGDSEGFCRMLTRYLADLYGDEPIPDGMIPRPGKNLYETVKSAAPALRRALEGARQHIGYSENIYQAFLKIGGQVRDSAQTAHSLSPSSKGTESTTQLGILIFDGAKTWQKNGLGYGGPRWSAHDRATGAFEVGDLGLKIYFEAARRFKAKNPEVLTTLQTAQGDEVVVVIGQEKLGKNPQAKIEFYRERFEATLGEVAHDFGISKDSPLHDALVGVNAHGNVVDVRTAGGKNTFQVRGTREVHANLEGALVTTEVDLKLRKLEARDPEAAGLVRQLIHGVMRLRPESQPTQLAAEAARRMEAGEQPLELDAFAVLRLAFDGPLKRAMERLAENNGKGLTHVQHDLAGPSVVNELGHPVADSLTVAFQDALTNELRAAGIADKVEIYKDGALGFAFRFREGVDKGVFVDALAKAQERFAEKIKADGVGGVRSAEVGTAFVDATEPIARVQDKETGQMREPTAAERTDALHSRAKARAKRDITIRMFGFEDFERGGTRALGALISIAHLYPDHSTLRSIFTDPKRGLLISENVLGALEHVHGNKWVREPEDLLSFLFREQPSHLNEQQWKEEIGHFLHIIGYREAKPGEIARLPGQVLTLSPAQQAVIGLERETAIDTLVSLYERGMANQLRGRVVLHQEIAEISTRMDQARLSGTPITVRDSAAQVIDGMRAAGKPSGFRPRRLSSPPQSRETAVPPAQVQGTVRERETAIDTLASIYDRATARPGERVVMPSEARGVHQHIIAAMNTGRMISVREAAAQVVDEMRARGEPLVFEPRRLPPAAPAPLETAAPRRQAGEVEGTVGQTPGRRTLEARLDQSLERRGTLEAMHDEVRQVARSLDAVRSSDRNSVPKDYLHSCNLLDGVSRSALDDALVEQALQIVYARRGQSPPIPESPALTGPEYMRMLATSDPGRAGFMNEHFGTERPSRYEAENALIILGDPKQSKAVTGSFHNVFMGESGGGNAGQGHVGVNGFYDPQTGRITAFGNEQYLPADIKARGRQFTLEVNVETGTIRVIRGGGNPSLMALDGMKVSEGTKPPEPGPQGPIGPGGGPREGPAGPVAGPGARPGGPVAGGRTSAIARDLTTNEGADAFLSRVASGDKDAVAELERLAGGKTQARAITSALDSHERASRRAERFAGDAAASGRAKTEAERAWNNARTALRANLPEEMQAQAEPVQRAAGQDFVSEVKGGRVGEEKGGTRAEAGARAGAGAGVGAEAARMEGAAERARAGPSQPAHAGALREPPFITPQSSALSSAERMPGPGASSPKSAFDSGGKSVKLPPINAQDQALVDAVQARYPEQRPVLEEQARQAQDAIRRKEAINEASGNMTVEQRMEADRNALRARVGSLAAKRPGVDPETAYNEGYPPPRMGKKAEKDHAGRLGALVSLGLELKSVATSDPNSFHQSCVSDVYQLMFHGDLEGAIGRLPGYEDAKITAFERTGLGSGAYMVGLEDGRSVIVKLFDGNADQFGARMLEARGVPAMNVHAAENVGGTEVPYGFDINYPDPRGTSSPVTEHKKFMIIENVHDLVGREVHYKSADGSMRNDTASSVALMNDILKGKLNKKNEAAVKQFYRSIETAEGMGEVIRDFYLFEERNFRAGVGDAHTGNAFVATGREKGDLVLGRIDTDPFGLELGVNDDGTPNTVQFAADFAGHGKKFLNFLAEASVRARTQTDSGGRALYSGKAWTESELIDLALSVLSGPRPGQGLLPPTPGIEIQRSRAVVQSHQGREFGMAFAFGNTGSVNSSMGGIVRVTTSSDMRTIMVPEYADHLNNVVLPALERDAGVLRQSSAKVLFEPAADCIIKGDIPSGEGGFVGSVGRNIRADERFGKAGSPYVQKKMVMDALGNAFMLQSEDVAAAVKDARGRGSQTAHIELYYDHVTSQLMPFGYSPSGTEAIKPRRMFVDIDASSSTVKEIKAEDPKSRLPPGISSLAGMKITAPSR